MLDMDHFSKSRLKRKNRTRCLSARDAVLLVILSCLQSGCLPQSTAPEAPVVLVANLNDDVDSKPGQDWTAFLGPHGDGRSDETGVDPALWSPHPPLKWTASLGVSYGAPSVVGERVLQFDRFGAFERLTCYDAQNGKEQWRWESPVEYDDMYGYNNGPRCSPLVDGDYVFTYGVAGQLSCIELTTGKAVWSKNLCAEYSVVQNFFGVASTPYIYKDLLLVMVGGSTEQSQRLSSRDMDRIEANGSAVVAFDKLSGEERYRLGDDLASYASMTVREIEGKPTGLAFLRSGLIAFEPETGKELFQFPWRASMLESVNAALPVTSGNQIMLSETYEIGSVLLDVKNGQPQVLRQDKGTYRDLSFRAHWSTPVLIDGYLYGCSGRNRPDSDFRCVRFSDGEVQWTRRGRERSSVLAVDGYLIVLGEHGTLELMRPSPDKLDVVAKVNLSEIEDPNSGEALLSYPCWAAPVLAHGSLYLRGQDRLVCLNLIPEQP